MLRFTKLLFIIFTLVFLLPNCSEEMIEVEYFGELSLDSEFGKEDGLSSAGISTSADNTSTAVWSVYNDWTDRNTSAARKAGLAWGEDSGLDWDEKYSLWVEGLRKIESYDGWGDTFEITNPSGKTLPAPVLECAEVAYFLRATFASWYHLPYFVSARDSSGTRIFMGHFGWRTTAGRYKNSSLFRDWYADYSSGDYNADNWPSDSRLRKKRLWGADDDYQPFIEEGARAGAYFDEMYLNKRVGHFLMLFLSNFGSMHLADSSNTFNLKAAEVREGDFLVKRHQRIGSGHTLIVKEVDDLIADKLSAEVASGSMPRCQPDWEEPAQSKYYFTHNECGGSGTNSEGDEYVKLGGGLKRWRIARNQNGTYRNMIPPNDEDKWISSTNYTDIAARIDEFEELLQEPTPEEKLEVILGMIEDKRQHLRNHPASCSARIVREDVFEQLYELMSKEPYSYTKEQVDRQYRKLEDYVFAELVYTQSKTCCWNSTTSAMYEIIMDYNENYIFENGEYRNPVVFMNNNGYETFRQHAATLGRLNEWVDWSEDESCSQRNTPQDVEEDHNWTDFLIVANSIIGFCQSDEECPSDDISCTEDACVDNRCQHVVNHDLCLPGQTCSLLDGCTGEFECVLDQHEPNNTYLEATGILNNSQIERLSICDAEEDWYLVLFPAGEARVTVNFSHQDGDIDLKLYDDTGTNLLFSSTGMTDSETIAISSIEESYYLINVYGYGTVNNYYSISIEVLE
jgi:hypothetical protein